MTDPSNQPTPGRRVASVVARGPDITVVLAVLLPLLTAGTLLLVRPDVPDAAAQPPELTALTRSTIVCPSGATQAYLSTMTESVRPGRRARRRRRPTRPRPG